MRLIDTSDKQEQKPCPEFPFFGAWYPDATCIEGMLWDLDSYEDGLLRSGGEMPCPFCNREGFIEYNLDEENGHTREVIEDWISQIQAKYGYQNKQQ